MKKFKTILDDEQRNQLCDKLVAEAKSKDIDSYKKIFTGDIDKPTLLFLLGGDRPPKIVRIKMGSSHVNVYELLLSISDERFQNKNYNTICVPGFMKTVICPEVLLCKNGNPIIKLSESRGKNK